MLEVHLNLLLEADVAADGWLQFLGLGLEGLVVEGGDEVGVHELEEVVDEVVGEEGLVGGYFGVVAKCGQSVEVEIGWEIALERVED